MKHATAFAATLLAAALNAAASDFSLYVAPDGDDSAAGTSSGRPLATLEAARDRIRAARKSGDTNRWTVTLAPGRYERTSPFELLRQDTGTLYAGDPRGRTLLTGSFAINGWKADPSNACWTAPLIGLADGSVYPEQLFVNGRRAVRARWPKLQTDWAYGEKRNDLLAAGAVAESVATNADRTVTARHTLKAQGHDLDLLAAVPASELRYVTLVIHHAWDTTRVPLDSFDPATATLASHGAPWPKSHPWKKISTYYLENLRPAFTAPGEWFLDPAAGLVRYRPLPGEKLERAVIEAPRSGLEHLLVLNGCSDIRFDDISFACTDYPGRRPGSKFGPSSMEPRQAAEHCTAAILADGAFRCALHACAIRLTAAYAAWFREDCRACALDRCTIEETGAGGVRIGTPSGTHPSTRCLVRNCAILHGGRIFANGVGVWIGNAPDNIVTHNRIADYYYSGVSCGWSWGYHGGALRNTISYNLIEDIGQAALSDLGGVYTLGTQTGTRVIGNVIRRIDSATYGGWGLYTDEGSEGILLADNLVYDTKSGSFHQHFGASNTVSNNILAFSREAQVCCTKVEDHLSCRFLGNIIYWAGRSDALKGHRTAQAKNEWDRNIWWCTAGAPLFDGKTFAQWQTEGRDRNGIVADPLFRDPAKRDFTFASDQTCRLTSFKPFDAGKAGIEQE